MELWNLTLGDLLLRPSALPLCGESLVHTHTYAQCEQHCNKVTFVLPLLIFMVMTVSYGYEQSMNRAFQLGTTTTLVPNPIHT